MNKKWTLHVENFAKIKSADVTIAPLMCFVGDNNSGKSYLIFTYNNCRIFGFDFNEINIRKRYFSQEAFRSQSI